VRTKVPEKLIKIIDDIDAEGNASLTRLTVLKKWFEAPGRKSNNRLRAFAVWVARRVLSRKGKTTGAAGELFSEARALLGGLGQVRPTLQAKAVADLHQRLRDFQNEFESRQWGAVRVINNWNLLLVEQALAIWLWHHDSPGHGYKLAADYCQHYDSRYGNGLNGPSRTKLEEMVRFMFSMEALEDEG
jgi:hypothetical protein